MNSSRTWIIFALAWVASGFISAALASEPGLVRVEAVLEGGRVRVLFTGAQIRPGVILTCGHCCQSAGGRGARVLVHTLDGGTGIQRRQAAGYVLCYDMSSDVGFVQLDDPEFLLPVYVLAPRGTVVRPGDGVYAFHWRHEPDRLYPVAGMVTRVNPYLGPATLETNTPPDSGDSGGPLVLAGRREIIGVTSAVDLHLRRGIYSGLEAIYQLLDRCGPWPDEEGPPRQVRGWRD